MARGTGSGKTDLSPVACVRFRMSVLVESKLESCDAVRCAARLCVCVEVVGWTPVLIWNS